jgi:hypothetical protein
VEGVKTIWKFPLPIEDRVEISMPSGAEILCVQTQRGYPQVWAICDTEAPTEKRLFYVRGTGQEVGVAEFASYLGTFQMMELVFHVFGGGLQ